MKGREEMLKDNRPRMRAVFSAVLLLAFLVAPLSPCLAKRHAAWQVPTYTKLAQGAGPDTNDRRSAPVRRAPMGFGAITLGGSANPTGVATIGSDGTPRLNATVTATGFVPKGPVDPSSMSIFRPGADDTGSGGDSKLMQQARSVSVMPLALMESDEESQKKAETILSAEVEQLRDLWESALTRSPDIQIVIQKLMPTNNPQHGASVILKMIAGAMAGAAQGVGYVSPNAGSFALSSAGSHMIYQLLSHQENKAQKAARLSQTEQIMLYKFVRDTAEKLVHNYRDYRKYLTSLSEANVDLEDLQNMVSEARAAQDAAKQIEMEYTLRKAQRECNIMAENVKYARQSLVDLAGAEAVNKLDSQLIQEQQQVKQATPSGSPGHSSPQQTAATPQQQG